jgi:hypothetical protein
MKRMLCVLGLLIGLAGCSDKEGVDSSQIVFPEAESVALDLIQAAPEAFAATEANQIVFDMAFRGLDDPEDPLFFAGSYGYGGRDQDTPFITDLKRYGVKNLSIVYNMEFKDTEISAVELSKGKAVAWYLDLDANGKVSANERITPLPPGKSDNETRFLSPDFSFTNREDQQVCFRALLRVVMSRKGEVTYAMWTPACVLEGRGTIDGSPAQFVLYPRGFSGMFDQFTGSYASLQIGTDQMAKRPDRGILSRLMVVNDRFYRVQLLRAPDKGQALRVALTEDTSRTGRIKAQLTLTDDATGEFSYARITGARPQDNISLLLPKTSMTLPVGDYRLQGAGLRFGTDQDKRWEVDMSEGPLFTVEADKDITVALGKPRVALRAVDNRDRYRPDAESKTTYKQGTLIYLNREVKGQAGEAYGRFQTTVKKHRHTDVEAHLTITGPKGKQILSKDLEYG